MCRKTIAIAILGVVALVGFIAYRGHRKKTQIHVKYNQHIREVAATTIQVDPLKQPELQVDSIEAGSLIEFVGKTPPPLPDEAPLLSIQITAFPRSLDGTTFNSISEMLDEESRNGQDFRLALKAPPNPGTYLFVVKWGFTKELQSFRAVVVKKKSKTLGPEKL